MDTKIVNYFLSVAISVVVMLLHGCAIIDVYDVREYEKQQNIEKLIDALKVPDREVHKDAAAALINLKNPRAVEPLIQAVTNTKESKDFRHWAVIVLGKLQDTRSVEPLIHVLTTDEVDSIRASAAIALGELQDVRAVEPLFKVVTTDREDSDVRSSAAIALGNFQDPRAVEPLIHVLTTKDKDSDVIENAVRALAKIGHQAKKAIPALIESFPKIVKTEGLRYTYTDEEGKGVRGEYSVEGPYWQEGKGGRGEYRVERTYRSEEEFPEKGGSGVVKLLDVRVEELNAQYGKYVTITDVSDVYRWARKYNFLDGAREGATVTYGSESVTIFYTLYAGGYALNKITAEDFGNDQNKWQKWWEQNKETFIKDR